VSNIAENGQTVVFETTGDLSPLAISARSGCTNVYEFRSDGLISQGSVHLISDGRDIYANHSLACGAGFAGIDVDGENILFSTADQLVPGDVDGVQRSLYDARVDGGFPPAVSAASCEGGCEGPVSAPPSLSAAPGSASLTGTGNLAPPAQVPVVPAKPKAKVQHCVKGRVLRGGRCVKVKRKVKAKAKSTSVALRVRGAHFHA
jgi:hypothetical protein